MILLVGFVGFVVFGSVGWFRFVPFHCFLNFRTPKSKGYTYQDMLNFFFFGGRRGKPGGFFGHSRKKESNVIGEMRNLLLFLVVFLISLAGEVWLEVSGWFSWLVDRSCLYMFGLSSIRLRRKLDWVRSDQIRSFDELGVFRTR